MTRKKKLIIAGSCAGIFVLALIFLRGNDVKLDDIPVYEVQSGPLTISVNSVGTVQSRDKIEIKSELEGNNTVLWVIEEGTKVKKGDLLLEFDASNLIEKRKEQEVDVANKSSSLLVATEKLEITRGDCEASLLNAEINLKLSKMDLEKFKEGEMPQELSQFQSNIALANEELQRAEEKLQWSQKLAEEGFLTRTELQADELSARRAAITRDMANMKMNVYTNYTVFKNEASLESDVRRNDRAFKRTAWQNRATIRQIESEVSSKTREYQRSTNRLAELNFQIEKSRVIAPTNGIVLYATSVQIARRMWWVQPLRDGSTANQRQDLIYIPLESGMIVEVMIPEASLSKLQTGMQSVIKIDAIPGREFSGKLVKIGLLPDGQAAQLSPDVKLYKCEIEFAATEPLIRSGMTCDVELINHVYNDVISVPVQCVVRLGESYFVYLVGKQGEPVAREVKTGKDNNRMIHILSGLEVGEQIMLAPPIVEERQSPTEKSGTEAEKGNRESVK